MCSLEDMNEMIGQAMEAVATRKISWQLAETALKAAPGSESLTERFRTAEDRLEAANKHLRTLQLLKLQTCNQTKGKQSD